MASGPIEQELQRRSDLWQQVIALGGPDGLSASQVNNNGLGLWAGGRGFYLDKERTGPLSDDGNGLTVGFLITGKHYPDDLDDQGVIYHYPKSVERLRSRDEGEIAATKACTKHGLPVFAVIQEGRKRNVRLGWVTGWDDEQRHFLILFGDQEPPGHGVVVDERPFEPFGAPVKVSTGKKSSRGSKQVKFRFDVMARYGTQCAFCPIRAWGVLDAAHLISKDDEGTDDPRNGLPLCATHHRAISERRHLLRINPETLDVIATGVETLESLGVTKSSLSHLPNKPEPFALQYLWDKQEEHINKSV